MPDISMCLGQDCPLKETCYRYKAIPSDWQSYFTEPPIKEDGTCDHHMIIWDKPKKKGGNNE